jgi:HSP20 family protein
MVIDFSSFYDFPRQMDRLFQDLASPYALSRPEGYPPVNLSEDESRLYVRAEIPGVDLSDVELTLNARSLVIKGERKVEKGKYYRQERPTGVFQRIVGLGVPVEAEGVQATLANGVLEVLLPKAKGESSRSIEVREPEAGP